VRDLCAALIQLNSGADPVVSLARAAELTREALARGAELVVLPENFWAVAPPGLDRRPWAADLAALGPGGDLPGALPPVLEPFLHLSRERPAAVIILGGLPELPPGGPPGKYYNTLLVVFGGKIVAVYRKIHRFDATLPDGTRASESDLILAGERPLVIDAPFGRIGLSICYDLRFPELYRALSAAGAEILVVPSAFTLLTGIDHWEPLLRARAIENQAYVLAPAQYGPHGHGRHSFGHSLAVDPWGAVIAQVSRGEGLALTILRADLLTRVRADLPALTHRRLEGVTPAEVVPLSLAERA
jgi:predicted amidohydrolase